LLQLLPKSAAVPEAARLLVRANGRLAREDRAGAVQAFEQATAIDGRLSAAHLLLAGLYSAAGDHDKAIDRLRRVVALEPNHAVALNDLAFALAIHHPDAIKEALAFAQRAYALAANNAAIADTLAWVLHLSGDNTEARRISAVSARGAPNHAEIQLHAAIIDAAAGAYEASARQLARALELDASLERSPDVQRLRAVLGSGEKK
jgi:tetratricopeptide (TPR) repeat protein